jgi:hypothetical protein
MQSEAAVMGFWRNDLQTWQLEEMCSKENCSKFPSRSRFPEKWNTQIEHLQENGANYQEIMSVVQQK